MTITSLWSKRTHLQPPTPDQDHYLNLYAEERAHHRDTATELATAYRTSRALANEITRLTELVDRLTHSSVNNDIAVNDALREHAAWHTCARLAEEEPAKVVVDAPVVVAPTGRGAAPNVVGGMW